ncbi:purine nucleoside permease [Gluconacetobacter azotocaptans]|uniref:Purine nucleoside permease n=1 Tax=Gluconacetobacter azotocaptans TaxID=142834 RepID=A0A7W4PDT8_9PROT|nr:purine nucleoside permease [Gluconacetobacter azotocaptans]MBB2188699.1 purine nucleoside permease [Gluconacetobacter azotocaptans]MBM9400455.1 purine nucleoside permease [Gluconacetobacter azotocaptans]GBQ35032.1 purine nucleoside transporter [Gluconacetobacter azotocaptans DSM 13594]
MNRHSVWGYVALAVIGLSVPARAAEDVRAVVIANWENGADRGDAPGEYQDWVEREHLDTKIAIRGAPDVVRRNRAGLYGVVLRHGVTDLAAFVLDPRFDFHHTYWLFTGISGIDPHAASVGSVAWARWVVDGDALREIDDRDIPKDWPYGLYAIGASRPDTLPANPNHYGSVTDVAELTKAYPLNQGLARWAFAISRKAVLADDPAVAARRRAWTGFPQAQRPPFVLMGETLGAERYWHGAGRNLWAENWVKLWTGGQGRFVMTNEESQTYQREMRTLAALGFVDAGRIMVLRSGSNFSMPPPGVPVTQSMGDEGPGQAVAFDNNERAGAPVLAEILSHWDRYRDHVPSAGPDDPGVSP